MYQSYQIFDLFGEPVYFKNLDEFITQCELKLDSYPVYETNEDPDERRLRTCEFRMMRQRYRHLLNQLYPLRGQAIRLRGEMRFSFLQEPGQVIHASVLDELPGNGLVVRYWLPPQTGPIVREVFLDEVRLVSLTYQTDPALHPELQAGQRPASRNWGMSQAQTVMPILAN